MLAETICSAVSAAGLGIAAITAYRKRFLTATRIAAYSLVPIGLVLTGAVEWVSGLVFKPSTWIGLGLLGLAWALFMTTRTVERRRAARTTQQDAVAPQASAASLGAGRTTTAPAPKRKEKQPEAAPADDFSDIEAILKKHGI
ncbi:hypothetical protein QIS99_11330 [Streptomyces sp. B-S-A8]|uniref:Uncharacterized protein n=1 Tax=Streptomyces solicavernae TaxID=3043614 RepID=A0ABT6RQS5_9ACTN|nr:hypothetical protein [Streptomyces sp. B-S-A8]MDI3386791.1 hypothetical protein [Streptomyces sp. B-S-A8]